MSDRPNPLPPDCSTLLPVVGRFYSNLRLGQYYLQCGYSNVADTPVVGQLQTKRPQRGYTFCRRL